MRDREQRIDNLLDEYDEEIKNVEERDKKKKRKKEKERKKLIKKLKIEIQEQEQAKAKADSALNERLRQFNFLERT